MLPMTTTTIPPTIYCILQIKFYFNKQNYILHNQTKRSVHFTSYPTQIHQNQQLIGNINPLIPKNYLLFCLVMACWITDTNYDIKRQPSLTYHITEQRQTCDNLTAQTSLCLLLPSNCYRYTVCVGIMMTFVTIYIQLKQTGACSYTFLWLMLPGSERSSGQRIY